MKKTTIIISSLIILAGVIFYSCSKESDNMNGSYKPNRKTYDFSHFGKIETVYNIRENPKKESDTLPKEVPEIGIDPRILDTIISNIEDSVPTIVKGDGHDCGLVGVFKKTTCKDYQELVIYFDTEDNNNQNRTDGETGASGKAYHSHSLGLWGQNDMEMHFCLVPQELFHGTGRDYAVLGWSKIACGTEFDGYCRNSIIRYIDCEDNSNITSISYGPSSNPYQNTLINTDFSWQDPFLIQADNKGNIRLNFLSFSRNCNEQTNFPNLGFEYGVLGTFPGTNFGHIYTDDEDDDNINYMLMRGLFGPNYQLIPQVSGLIDGNGNGLNTNFYITWLP